MISWYHILVMNNLVATNIRLPKEELSSYRELALSMGISFSQLVRKVLSGFAYPTTGSKISHPKISFFDIEKISVRGGMKTSSIDHDKYIYRH